MKDKAHRGPARIMLRRSALSVLTVVMLLAAIIPVSAGDAPADISNSSTSTYIVVFNDTPQAMTMSAQSTSNLVSSYGGQVKYRYNIINGMAVTIPDSMTDQLKSLPNVKYVEKDQPVYALLDKAVPQIGADQDWAESYTGLGIKVAVLDTGVDATHSDLNGTKVIAWKDFTGAGYTSPHDGHGHGTHVSGIIAGTGNASSGLYKGVAPDASLIEGKVLDDSGSGYNSWIIAGMDWAVANGAQVISLSLGGSHSQAMDDEVAKVTSEGVVVVVAAGNSGQKGPGTIECPGDAPAAITVGAVDKSDVIAYFSSLGPNLDGSIKPDVMNVGVNIWSAKASGTNTGKGTQYYLQMSGTSMATPMTSGVVALILQKNSSLTPAQVKNLLEQTAKPMKVNTTDPIPNNNYGWGRVQARYALDNVTISANSLPKFPQTVWSKIGKNGTVVGKVTASTNLTAGISGAYFAIVNASNTSQVYCSGFTDSNGQYYVTGLNATYSSVLHAGPHGQTSQDDYDLGTNMYLIFSDKSPYGTGYSASFGIDANQSGATTTSVVLYNPPVNLTKYGPKTVWSDLGLGGMTTGRVTSSVNGSVGIAGAYIALVNASNVSQEYNHTYADAYGNYNFTCINASYSSVLHEGPNGQNGQDYQLGTSLYQIYANKSPYGEGYSALFGVDANQSAATTTSVVIFTKPARIDLIAERQYVNANSSDNITVTAYMYDALGYPVADGYKINFTVGNATSNSFTRGGFRWVPGNGSLGGFGNNVSLNNPTHNNQGIASVQFGWVNAAYSGNNTTIWAYSADNASINASIKIDYDLVPFTYNLVQGWNLIDVPLNITNTNLTDFFPDSTLSGITDIWGWNESAQDFEYYNPDSNDSYFEIYPHLTNIETGRAYWVKMNNVSSFTINGTIPNCAPNSTMPLVKGWNFIGPTGFNMSTPQDMFPGAVDIWGWNQSAQDFEYYNPDPTDSYFEIYPKMTTVKTGYGYWANYPDQE